MVLSLMLVKLATAKPPAPIVAVAGEFTPRCLMVGWGNTKIYTKGWAGGWMSRRSEVSLEVQRASYRRSPETESCRGPLGRIKRETE